MYRAIIKSRAVSPYLSLVLSPFGTVAQEPSLTLLGKDVLLI